MSEQPTARITVRHQSGARFLARVRSHEVVVDQTPRGGGNDTGPEPIELFGVALATCVALYVQRFCEARSLPTEGLLVEVEQHSSSNPHRVGQFALRVVLPENFPNRYAELIERVARSCPVHNTIVHGAEVRVRVDTPVIAV